MSVIFLLIPFSIVVAGCFLAAFIWAVRSGQYEDTCTPSMRVLLEEVQAGRDGPAAGAPNASASLPAETEIFRSNQNTKPT